MKPYNLFLGFVTASALLGPAQKVLPQAVGVTMALDAPAIGVGQSTTLHIYAQVVPSLRTNSDRIFSWYVDVLNTNGGAVNANYGAMLKTASDKDPRTSSNGVSQAANRQGIYDTFLNLPGAGTSNAVELMSIPVTGVAIGKTRFMVQAGSGVPQLSSDFQVAPKGGGAPLLGGNYTAALIDLSVTNSTPCEIQLHVAPLANGGGPNGTLRLTFGLCPGRNHTVEFRSALDDLPGWQSLPGAPHNSGIVTVTNTVTQRFFRVRANTP
jgi:hypothetical protein